MDHPLLDEAVRSAIAYIDSLPDRPVGRPADVDALRTALGAPLTDEGDGNHAALQALVAGTEDGIVATAGPRYFGFVIGGSLPVGLAAEWLVSAWDQNAGMHVCRTGGRRHRGGGPGLVAGPPGTAGERVRGLRHRRADGQCHGPHGRPSPGARAGGLGRGGRRPVRGTARHRRGGRRAPRGRRPGAALPRVRDRWRRRVGRRRPRRPRPLRPGPRPRRGRGRAGHRVHAGREREHGSLRSDRRGLHHRPRARGVGPRRRRVRPLGRGQQGAPPPPRGLRGGRQLGRRHAQVAQRPLRLLGGAHRPPRGPPGGHGHCPPPT